jgi:ornithine--oxo-acid transaminase
MIQAKPTHQNIIRMAPPLVISEEQIKDALRIIEDSIMELAVSTKPSNGH